MTERVFHHQGLRVPLSKILEAQNANKIFLCTGRRSYQLSGASSIVEKALQGLNCFHYQEISPNPKLEEVLKGCCAINAFKPDLVLAIGGGSVLDTAKLLASSPFQTLNLMSMLNGEPQIVPEKLPLVAIPTTSGSGSEATHFSVVYYQQKKYSIADPSLLPDFVILAPELTSSLSPNQTAICGLDATCQAIESIWAVSSTQESLTFANEALSLLLPNIRIAVSDPSRSSRDAMLLGAHQAGKAINISKTTAAHAYSYYLTTHFGIPHGHAVSIFLGVFLSLIGRADESRCASPMTHKVLNERLQMIFGHFGVDDSEQCAACWRQLVRDLELADSLQALGILDVHQLKEITQNVNLERLGNHPMTVLQEELLEAMRK